MSTADYGPPAAGISGRVAPHGDRWHWAGRAAFARSSGSGYAETEPLAWAALRKWALPHVERALDAHTLAGVLMTEAERDRMRFGYVHPTDAG